MIYCYLSDTALAPLLSNESTRLDKAITNYNELMGINGVCQVNERVLSMFNTEYQTTIGSGTEAKIQKYPNLVLDPRTPANTIVTQSTYQTGRIKGLFDAQATTVSGTANEYAVGEMCLHYDAYKAATSGEAGNLLASLANTAENNIQFAQLFNIIETCVLSHTYSATDRVWTYKNSTSLDSILNGSPALYGAGSSTEAVAGYIAGSIVIPNCNKSTDKKARVRNKSSIITNCPIKTGIGDKDTLYSYSDDILFPDYIQFSYRFAGLSEVTHLRIYLNPKAFLEQYNLSTITHIICPTKPADLLSLSYGTVEICLTKSSKYVADVMTGEVTKTDTDPLETTNCTGASSLTIRYTPTGGSSVSSEYKFTFTCVYKGRKPNTSELRAAIKTLMEEASGGTSVKSLFPDLYATTSYILVPMYETRIIADTNLNTTYCTNIFSSKQLYLNYNGINTVETLDSVPSDIKNKASILNSPAYYMHILAYPEDYVNSTTRLDQVVDFKSYQPIATTDVYWPTMNDASRELNKIVAKLVAYQLTGYKPVDIEFTVDSKVIFDNKARSYLTFSIGDYSFSMMTKESYISSN